MDCICGQCCLQGKHQHRGLVCFLLRAIAIHTWCACKVSIIFQRASHVAGVRIVQSFNTGKV